MSTPVEHTKFMVHAESLTGVAGRNVWDVRGRSLDRNRAGHGSRSARHRDDGGKRELNLEDDPYQEILGLVPFIT
jgi:hypothetical protein